MGFCSRRVCLICHKGVSVKEMHTEADTQIIGIVITAICKREYSQAINIIGGYDLMDIITPLGSWIDVALVFDQDAFIDCLLRAGFDINLSSERFGNSVTAATRKGRLDLVQKFLFLGAGLDYFTAEGNPLLAAIQGRHEEIGLTLIDHGISFETGYSMEDGGVLDFYDFASAWGASKIANRITKEREKDG